jgi:8-amino-7-oxononanoate synthase
MEQHHRGQYRTLKAIGQERTLLDFSTNDYLNLSRHDEVIAAGIMAGQAYGVGATGSRLLSGNLELYKTFEQTIAQDKHSEAALLFNSGFQANVSALSCLLDDRVLHAKPLVFFDQLNHASLYQAVFLSKATLCRYRSMHHLELLLERYKQDPRPKFIVTETMFGMDGHLVPLEHMVALTHQHHALLYLDEAHATGILGVNGYGLSTTLSLQHIPHVMMGTFSKAVGVSGGYVACHNILYDYFINKATGFMYSTAASPMVIGAAFKAWTLIKSLNKERNMLHVLGHTLRDRLKNNGFDVGTSQTHIVPIRVKTEAQCVQLQKKLLEKGIMVSCIRPPTVPPGTSRLRIALTAKHTVQDVERLVETLNIVYHHDTNAI